MFVVFPSLNRSNLWQKSTSVLQIKCNFSTLKYKNHKAMSKNWIIFSADFLRKVTDRVKGEIFPSFSVIHFHWWYSLIYEVQLKVIFTSRRNFNNNLSHADARLKSVSLSQRRARLARVVKSPLVSEHISHAVQVE